MNIPPPLSELLTPLFDALPLECAMPELVPGGIRQAEFVGQVEELVKNPLINGNPALEAALWLYVDDLDRSHQVSQGILTSLGSAWHGVMHRREGDFWNSKYWFRKAGDLSALREMDPSAFVDRVEQTYKNNPPELLEYQRKEWKALFEWSAKGQA